jgi:hypothetical protein
MDQINEQIEVQGIDSLNDTGSIIAEQGDPNDQNLDEDETDVQTAHTSRENPTCEIPISEDPINFKKNQIYLKLVSTNPAPVQLRQLFRNSKQRFTVQISKENFETDFLNFVKEYIVPNIQYYCYFEDDTLHTKLIPIIQNTCSNNIKFTRYLKLLTDVENPDEQQQLIEDYHLGKNNHRGTTESLLKLSSKYYWPNMQKSLQNYINRCDTCRVVKYDRKPLKLKFNITPTPTKPFEVLHLDVLKYEHLKFLTITDAFSKYAQAYLLETSQAIEIAETLLYYFTHHSTPTLCHRQRSKIR